MRVYETTCRLSAQRGSHGRTNATPTTYHPDCEYIDGELLERNVGKWEHARLQYLLNVWFGTHEVEWGVMGSTEQRTRVAPSRVRIPDIVLVKRERQTDVLSSPPVLAVEILSPEDTFTGMRQRIADLQGMGVHTIWIIDPKTRSGQMCSGATWTSADKLAVQGTLIYVDLPELFRALEIPA